MASDQRGKEAPAPPITIREMELGDLAAVYELGSKLFTSELSPTLYRTWDEHELALMFTSDTETCLIAEEGDELVGFVLGTVIDKPYTSWTYGYIVWLGVKPRLARRGVGRRLVDRLTQRFVKLGVRMLMVDTAADNDSAIAFFEDQGFGSRSEHVYLTKNLSPESPKRPPVRKRRRPTTSRRRAKKRPT